VAAKLILSLSQRTLGDAQTAREYEDTAAYIANNPANWLTDEERPADHDPA